MCSDQRIDSGRGSDQKVFRLHDGGRKGAEGDPRHVEAAHSK